MRIKTFTAWRREQSEADAITVEARNVVEAARMCAEKRLSLAAPFGAVEILVRDERTIYSVVVGVEIEVTFHAGRAMEVRPASGTALSAS